MQWRRVMVAVLVCLAACGAIAASASASSILYKKSGRLWVASPNGTNKHAIKKTRASRTHPRTTAAGSSRRGGSICTGSAVAGSA